MKYKVRNAKPAGITIEVALAALLSVTVLILVLGLFSQNLQVMAANSNINNLFNNSNRISNSGFNRDYSKSVVNVTTSQQSVGTVGDQGLELQKIHANAQAAIEKYALASKTTPLSVADTIDLAKYITIYSESCPVGEYASTQYGDYKALGATNGIFLMTGSHQTTVASSPQFMYDWGDGNDNASAADKSSDQNAALVNNTPERIANIQVIETKFPKK